MRWLLHTGLLFAAMLAAFVAVWPAGFYITLGAVFAVHMPYLLWPSIRDLLRPSIRGRERKKQRKAEFREFVIQSLCTISAAMAAVAFLFASLLTWLYHAYRWEQISAIYDADPDRPRFPFEPADYLPSMSKTAIVLALAALLLGLAFAVRPWVERARAGKPARPYRGSGPPSILSSWLGGFIGMGFALLLAVAIGPAMLFYYLLDMVRWDRIPTAWDLFLSYPVLPLGFLAAAGAVVSWQGVLQQNARSPDDPPDPETGTQLSKAIGIGMPAYAAIAVAEFGVLFAALLYPLHFLIVLTTAQIPAVAAGAESGKALARWAERQQASGPPDSEIVATINELGHWSPDAPEEGLARLLPDLIEDPEDGIARWNCTVTVTAGAIDAAEREDGPWLGKWDQWTRVMHDATRHFNEEMDGGTSESGEEEEDEAAPIPPVRFCMKATCPSPVAWQAPDALALYSSHPSASPHWLFMVSPDLLLEGRRAVPGGYCTADGELAESYQG